MGANQALIVRLVRDVLEPQGLVGISRGPDGRRHVWVTMVGLEALRQRFVA